MTNKHKRKQYLINRPFQIKFILFSILLILIGAGLSGTILYLFGASELETAFSSAHLTIKNTWDILLTIIVVSHAIGVILMTSAVTVLVLMFSHRLAGPMYHVQKTLNEITHGNLSIRTSFRKHDELIPLEKSLNEMIESLKTRIDELYGLTKDLESQIAHLPESGELSAENRERLTAGVELIRKALDRFNTTKTEVET